MRLFLIGLMGAILATTANGQPKSDPPVIGELNAGQKAAHVAKFKRGALPTPPAKIAAAPQMAAPIKAPPAQFSMIANKLSMWGNSQYGVCVMSERAEAYGAWSTYCGAPLFVTEAEVIRWSRAKGTLNGTWAEFVLKELQTDGFIVDGKNVKGGPFAAVDYRNSDTLKTALTVGPVTVAIDADALPSGAGSVQGWYAVGAKGRHNTDHEIGFWGYGTAKYLCDKLNVPVPSGLDPNKEMFGAFSWSTMGMVDQAWINDTVVEAWVSSPTIAGMNPTTLAPTAKLTANPITVASGQATTITWETDNATAVTLNGSPVIASGSQMFTPAATTVYELVAAGGPGTTPATAKVTVQVGTGPPPGPREYVMRGEYHGESWSFDPKTMTLTVSPGITVRGGKQLPDSSTPPPQSSAPAPMPGPVGELLELHNTYRAQQGLPALTLDQGLCDGAAANNRWLIGRGIMAGHSGLFSRFGGATENCAGGYDTAAGAFGGWLRSRGHAANITGPFGRVGFHVEAGRYTAVYGYGASPTAPVGECAQDLPAFQLPAAAAAAGGCEAGGCSPQSSGPVFAPFGGLFRLRR